jgi:hypothetical protein
VNTQFCLDANYTGQDYPGQVVVQSTCNGSPGQVFQFLKWSNGLYNVISANGLCLDWSAGGPSNPLGYPTVVLANCGATSTQQWQLSVTNGIYTFVTSNGTNCLDVDGGNGNVPGMQAITVACQASADEQYQVSLH